MKKINPRFLKEGMTAVWCYEGSDGLALYSDAKFSEVIIPWRYIEAALKRRELKRKREKP